MYQNILGALQRNIRVMTFKVRMLSPSYKHEVQDLVAGIKFLNPPCDPNPYAESNPYLDAYERVAHDYCMDDEGQEHVLLCSNSLPAHLQQVIEAAYRDAESKHSFTRDTLQSIADAIECADPGYVCWIVDNYASFDYNELYVGKRSEVAEHDALLNKEAEEKLCEETELRDRLSELHADIALQLRIV